MDEPRAAHVDSLLPGAVVPAGLSVVLPVLNEAALIDAQLRALLDTPGVDEIVVVDGGSDDGTAERVSAWPSVRLIFAPRGRGLQLNRGAEAARGGTLLFLHADVTLPPGAAFWVRDVLARPGVAAGAFRTWTVARRPLAWAPLLHLADLRSRYTSLPYGDQALFLRAETLRAVGGFRPLPLLEDLDLARRLRARGAIVTVPARVEVDGRRFVAHPLRFTALDNAFPLLHRLGVSAHRLARWYGHIR